LRVLNLLPYGDIHYIPIQRGDLCNGGIGYGVCYHIVCYIAYSKSIALNVRQNGGPSYQGDIV